MIVLYKFIKNLLCVICLRFDWVMKHLLCDKETSCEYFSGRLRLFVILLIRQG